MSNPKTARMVELSQSRLVRYVFNYNVLESVSIAISTCILLAGMVGLVRVHVPRLCWRQRWVYWVHLHSAVWFPWLLCFCLLFLVWWCGWDRRCSPPTLCPADPLGE
jgi:hypothetical protein